MPRARLRLLPASLAVVAFALLALTAALPAGALAGKPVVTVIHVDETFVDPFLSDACGFPVQIHDTGTVRIMTFLDEGGAVDREILVFPRFTSTGTNLDTGTTLSSPSPSVVHVEPHPDGSATITVTGLSLRLVVPGEGLVFADTGRIVLVFEGPDDPEPDVVFAAGQHDEDVAPICAALA